MTIERRLWWADREGLDTTRDDLYWAVKQAEAAGQPGMAKRLRDLTVALKHGNAPAGEAQPAAEDPTPDMSVTVTWPAERGQMQSVVYGRESAPDPETLTGLDRRIIRVLLEHALEHVNRLQAIVVRTV